MKLWFFGQDSYSYGARKIYVECTDTEKSIGTGDEIITRTQEEYDYWTGYLLVLGRKQVNVRLIKFQEDDFGIPCISRATPGNLTFYTWKPLRNVRSSNS